MKKTIQLAAIAVLGLLAATPLQAQRLRGLSGPFGQSVNWSCLQGGIQFVICKATQSTDTDNSSRFLYCAQNGSSHGIYVGCYHRCEPRTHWAEQEAAYFWSKAGPVYESLWNQGYLLSPALDVEDELDGSSTGYNGDGSSITLTEWCNRWYNYVNSYAEASGMYFVEFTYVNEGSAYLLNPAPAGDSWIANPDGLGGNLSDSPWTGTGTVSPWCGGDCWRMWQDKWNFVSQCTSSGATCENYYNGSSTSALKSDLGVKSH